ncbi:MAG: hypothetical protein ACQESR_19375 [Planctomycetota bacterium]
MTWMAWRRMNDALRAGPEHVPSGQERPRAPHTESELKPVNSQVYRE